MQPDLLHHQAWWTEFMLQFDAKIVYIKGEDNTAADALLRLPTTDAADSTEAVNAAQGPYNYGADDEDVQHAHVILPASESCPLYNVHALVEMDIATTKAVTVVLLITQVGNNHERI